MKGQGSVGLLWMLLICVFLTAGRGVSADEENKPPVFYAGFENTADAVTGQKANLHNTTPDFVKARFGNGLLCDSNNKAVASYLTDGSIKKESGTVEFWVRLMEDPVADGNGRGYRSYFCLDGQEYRNGLFGVFWSDRPDDPAVLRITCGMGGPRGVNYDDNRKAKDWKKGELHHFAITWQDDVGSDFYIDGQNVYSIRIEGFKIKNFDQQFFVGGGDAVDELTIYDYPRNAGQIKAVFQAREPLSAVLKNQADE